MPQTSRRVYLVRHAQPNAPEGLYYAGGTDLPLSPKGVECACAAAPKLGINPPNLCCSTMLRARQTLEYLFPARKQDFKIVPNLYEILGGEMELKPREELWAFWAKNFERKDIEAADCPYPGGESLRQMQQRAVAAFEKLLGETEGDLLAVLHGGVIYGLLSHYFDFDLNNVFRYPLHYCSVNELAVTDDGIYLSRFNWTPEL